MNVISENMRFKTCLWTFGRLSGWRKPLLHHWLQSKEDGEDDHLSVQFPSSQLHLYLLNISTRLNTEWSEVQEDLSCLCLHTSHLVVV